MAAVPGSVPDCNIVADSVTDWNTVTDSVVKHFEVCSDKDVCCAQAVSSEDGLHTGFLWLSVQAGLSLYTTSLLQQLFQVLLLPVPMPACQVLPRLL